MVLRENSKRNGNPPYIFVAVSARWTSYISPLIWASKGISINPLATTKVLPGIALSVLL